ncbi:mll9348 (plasmid) [Mesorhizobium japonicum MAFF 303099]|uniref:Mll9348 protein n=1 Tax=Mesorhizobium japonicum (strain LMG 29417 / CECT 9101 / MAFF 303099) TaxID=266835 RepID=Q981J5_RHILO|nr:mll9348 [Mesorhizobium japonicum MAFF 303099]
MILRPKLLRHAPVAVGAALAALATPVPTWLRAAAAGPDSVEDAAFAAAAALTALDAVVRRQERWAGVWRQRLALAAAAATAKRAGRVEDEAALRDALLLTRPGDDVGPAGRMLLAWRTLASRPVATLVSEAVLVDVAADLGSALDKAAAGQIGDEIQAMAGAVGNAVGGAVDAIALLERHDSRAARELGPWLADAVLAGRLGWAHAVPLSGLHPVAGGRRSPQCRTAIGAGVPATHFGGLCAGGAAGDGSCGRARPPRRRPAGCRPKTAGERIGCRRRKAAF